MFHLEGLTCVKAQERHGALAHLITPTKGFLGGPVVENPPASAADMGSIPGLGRFHVLEQLSLSTTTRENPQEQ